MPAEGQDFLGGLFGDEKHCKKQSLTAANPRLGSGAPYPARGRVWPRTAQRSPPAGGGAGSGAPGAGLTSLYP